MKQRTLAQSFKVEGKGLHTGLVIEAEFCPAPENHGYKIQRTDLENEPIIDAVAENVTSTQRGTVVQKGDVSVSTIEHALAALYAAGIDNCLIKVNAPEVPILDGSAKEYCEKIAAVGIEEQNMDKDYYIVRSKIEVRDPETGSSIIVLPDDDFSIDTMISFNSPVLSNQFASLDNTDDFAKDIASSRTFVFVREVEPLVKANLIKGGDLDNAIVIYDTPVQQSELDRLADLMGVPHKHVSEFGYINNRPLTVENEPARHKLLDVMGDIALIGRPLKGKVIATRPGHTINTTFAKKIRKEIKRQEIQAPLYNPSVEPIMDVNRIRELLPHRYPFLLVDKVIEKTSNHIVGVKNVTGNEPFFLGHFPQEPVQPGVLTIEMLAQTGAVCALSLPENRGKIAFFAGIDKARFRGKAGPGDTLTLEVEVTKTVHGVSFCKGTASVDGKRIVTAEFSSVLGE